MIDPGYVELATALVSDTVMDTGRRLLRVGARAKDRRAFLRGQMDTDRALRSAIELAGRRMAGLSTEVPGVSREALEAFLTSPEAAQLVRQIFILDTATDAPLPSVVKHQFVLSLASHLGVPAEQLEPHGAHTFDALAAATMRGLQLARAHGDTADTAEATANLRHLQLTEHLVGVERNLELLQGGQADVAAILEFERRYQVQVLQREAVVRPASVDRGTSYPLELLYVAPLFTSIDAESTADVGNAPIPYSDFVASVWRGVILGDPGGGKSSLCAKLCVDAIRGEDAFADTAFPRTPLLVPLRDYFGAKHKDNVSILQFVEARAMSRYQLPSVPNRAFEYLLGNGRAFLIFDGLDEILAISDRRDIVGDVESLAALYPQVPALLLSRRAVYGEAPIRSGGFDAYRLMGFDEGQVKEYATRWFDTQSPSDPEERDRNRESFLTETESQVSDLRRNPMMLGLLANIYAGPGSLPYSRPAVLNRCAIVLYELWDSRRGIRAELSFRPAGTARTDRVGFSFELDLRKLLEFLAHWIYNSVELQAGIPERRFIDKTVEYLVPRVYERQDEGRAAAVELVELCRGRTWVFSDKGKSEGGDVLFAFAHHTFLEYFAACHLVSTHPVPQALFSELWPRIARGDGDQMVELAIHVEATQVDGAADDIIDALLVNAPIHSAHATRVLSVAARILAFLIPTPAAVRKVVRQVLAHAALLAEAGREAEAESRLLGPLANAGAAVQRYVRSECEAIARENSADVASGGGRRLGGAAMWVLEAQAG